MILPPEQTERFYRIWWALLSFVNGQRHLVPDLPPEPAPESIKPTDAAKIRDALWKEDTLREKFIAENAERAVLPPEDLEIVASWKYRVAGTFFVWQHLKKYSVFLDDKDPPHAYGVLGLVSPIEDVIGPYLPVLVQAVLLPFEDKIIYDSLLAPYRMTFGPGIRANLKTAYRDVQERAGIITSLIPRAEPPTADEAGADVRARNDKIIAGFRKALYKAGLSPKMVEQHTSNTQAFADHLSTQSPPRSLLEMRTKDVEAYLGSLDAKDAKTCVTSFKRYARFLWDSARSDPDALYDLQDFLKSYRHAK